MLPGRVSHRLISEFAGFAICVPIKQPTSASNQTISANTRNGASHLTSAVSLPLLVRNPVRMRTFEQVEILGRLVRTFACDGPKGPKGTFSLCLNFASEGHDKPLRCLSSR